MRVVRSRESFATARAGLPGTAGLVPTMGALHAGHRALLTKARQDCASVIATVFVNPMQFGPGEDLERYPRSLEQDLALCESAGVDLVWAPEVKDVYPHGEVLVHVDPGRLGTELEGRSRPTHFAGMLTVVAKFLNLVRPDSGYFGEKDYQQLTLIRQMVLDLELGVKVVGVTTVREGDGLALSSRNVYLSPQQRSAATSLSRALRAGQEAGGAGQAAVLATASDVLAAESGVDVDYLELRDPMLHAAPERGAARLLVAARVGPTRLIDNVAVQL